MVRKIKPRPDIEFATGIGFEQLNNVVFVVKHHLSNSRKHEVTWNDDIVSCSCQFFEFWGILCRHILKIFIHRDCFMIPSRYILQHWCSQDELGEVGRNDVLQETMSEELHCGNQNNSEDIAFVQCPPCSKTKGRPKQKRQKGGKT